MGGQQAIAVRLGVSQSRGAPFHADDGDTLLHRNVVEILEAMIDTRVSFEVSDDERGLVERAERHLLGAGPGAAASVAHGHQSVDWGQRKR